MIHSAPADILIGISLDHRQHSMELLSWAIANIARPRDTIVALHVLVVEAKIKRHQTNNEKAKLGSLSKYQTQIRRAKAFVISVMGEFANICSVKQINLEARVGFNSGVGKGLIEEARDISAKFLILGSTSEGLNKRISCKTNKYCLEHTPKSCSLVMLGKSGLLPHEFQSDAIHIQGWSRKKNDMNDSMVSPRTVLNVGEGDSQSAEEDSSSIDGSTLSTVTGPPTPPLPETKMQPSLRKMQTWPLKRISSFFRFSSFDSSSKKREDDNDGASIKERQQQQQPLLKCFSYKELANATNNFHSDNIVGKGGYSEVYRGDLDDGHSIAVKRLAKDNNDESKEKEFLVELGIIGHVNHPNTASLLGFCVENGLYLIFNFYPNGTLSSALHSKMSKKLEWPERYRIALGIARGLHYLHKLCKHRIIHRDIKASNVLLGPDYEPQISDFGLAKWLPSKWTHHAVIPIEGTFGYLAPEYFMHGIVDEKTDVFAFGVVLLEIITGRRPVDSSKQNLLLWAKPQMESGDVDGLVDPDLDLKYDPSQLHRLVLTASYCVRQSSNHRPTMTEVLELLKHGDESEIAKSRRIPSYTADDENEMDDYSMVFGYEVPSDISSLDDI